MRSSEYTSTNAVADMALTHWHHLALRDHESNVLPDGCRDFILRKTDPDNQSWFISDLSEYAYCVPAPSGTEYFGIRLQPGVQIRVEQLNEWLLKRDPMLLFNTDQLDEFCIRSSNLADALDCLCSGEPSIASVAKVLGLTTRSLQRLVKSETGQTPHFWFSLARVRKAGRSLQTKRCLTEAALDAGFSDQAHMNREMKKWFSQTPRQLMQCGESLSLLSEPGYGKN